MRVLKIKLLLGENQGFTLVELLAVAVVLVSVGAIVAGILFSSLRGSSKSNNLSIVQQNGNNVILQMQKTLRDAGQFGGVSVDGECFETSCSEEAQKVCLLEEGEPPPTEFNYLRITPINGEEIFYKCDDTAIWQGSEDETGEVVYSEMIDTKNLYLSNCSFSCSQNNPTDFPNIGIDITVNAKSDSSKVNFRTSVLLRNYR